MYTYQPITEAKTTVFLFYRISSAGFYRVAAANVNDELTKSNVFFGLADTQHGIWHELSFTDGFIGYATLSHGRWHWWACEEDSQPTAPIPPHSREFFFQIFLFVSNAIGFNQNFRLMCQIPLSMDTYLWTNPWMFIVHHHHAWDKVCIGQHRVSVEVKYNIRHQCSIGAHVWTYWTTSKNSFTHEYPSKKKKNKPNKSNSNFLTFVVNYIYFMHWIPFDRRDSRAPVILCLTIHAQLASVTFFPLQSKLMIIWLVCKGRTFCFLTFIENYDRKVIFATHRSQQLKWNQSIRSASVQIYTQQKYPRLASEAR